MPDTILQQWLSVFVFMVVGLATLPILLSLSKVLRPHKPLNNKLSTYECGQDPLSPSWVQFNPRFFSIAVLFLIFDVELVLVFPVATIFKKWVMNDVGNVAFFELFFFLGVLFIGLLYVIYKKDFNWAIGERGKTKQ